MRVGMALAAGCDMVIVCNQTRKDLYNVLENNQETFSSSQTSLNRITAFKQQMRRFKQLDSKSDTTLSSISPICSLSETMEDTPHNDGFSTDKDFNKTKSI